MDHVGDLLLVVADLVGAVVLHHDEGRPGQAVDLARLAAAVALAVEGGEVEPPGRRRIRFRRTGRPAPRGRRRY